MPRGDGTGPLGTGPVGRGGCLGLGRGFGFGRRLRGRGVGLADSTVKSPDVLEEQAARMEEQAASLRNLAKQNRRAE